MTQPATFRSAAEAQRYLESFLETRLGLEQDLSLDDSPPTEAEHELAAPHAAERATLAAEVAHGGIEVAGVHAPVAMAGGALVAPAVAFAGMAAEVVSAHREGTLEAHRMEYHRAVGGLALLENRADRSSRTTVEGRSRTDGHTAMGAAIRFGDPGLDRAREAVALLRNDGYAAVLEGMDRGRDFQARYHGDLVFKQAVDHARSARANDPARFEAIRREVADARANAA